MRTIIALLLASCVVSFAQTNTDSSGYVTNANLLTPFTLTNSAGDVITNAVLVKLMPNKFIYKFPPSGEGVARFDLLPKDLQEKFGYNPATAAVADEADKQKHEADLERQKEIALGLQRRTYLEGLKKSLMQKSRTIDGRVIQRIPAGLLIDSGREQLNEEGRTASGISPDGSGDVWQSGPEHVREADSPGAYCLSLCLLTDYPKYDETSDGDYIHILAYPTGQYVYTTVQNSSKTIRKFSCDFDKAILTAEEK